MAKLPGSEAVTYLKPWLGEEIPALEDTMKIQIILFRAEAASAHIISNMKNSDPT